MTNYRFSICEYHDKPQFKFCFDCGSPLKEVEMPEGKTLTCSRNWVHVRIFLRPHEGDLEGDCEGIQIVE